MSRINRRQIVAASMAAALALPLAGIAGSAQAQDWPNDIIRIIVPFPPGGSVDVLARMIQPSLQERLGQNIVIDNRGGASGSIGAAAAAGAEPDGNTWLFVFDTQAVNPSLLPDMPFDSVNDLDPVMLIGTAPNVVATQTASPFETFEQVIEEAREDAGAISYGSIGTGSLGHLTLVLLTNEAGVELTHVPYRGGGPVVNDAVAGHVDLMIGSAALVSPQVDGGNLRPLLQTGRERHPTLQDVPTAVELGYDIESLAWWGVFAPAGTPPEIVARFEQELRATLQEPEISERLTDAQKMDLVLSGPDEFREFFAEQMETWGAVVRENDIRGDS
jgi:tripartite-type tricarboxylate transporter receptor subunit TctC